jgi:hypothetical protein
MWLHFRKAVLDYGREPASRGRASACRYTRVGSIGMSLVDSSFPVRICPRGQQTYRLRRLRLRRYLLNSTSPVFGPAMCVQELAPFFVSRS